MSDWIYQLERTFPNLAGARTFFLAALAIMALCAALFFVTRKKVHLLTFASAGIYVLPLMMNR